MDSRYFNYHIHPLNQLDAPKCDGCGHREQECWNTCKQEKGEGNERGYCGKCDSFAGARGACCKLNDFGDPEECSLAKPSSFLYTTYHMCVLVPGTF